MQITLFLALLLFQPNTLAENGPVNWQMNFQEAASPVMEKLYQFHNMLLVVCIAIVAIVVALIGYVCVKFNAKANPIPAKFSHNVIIEVIWTIIPVIILIMIAIPSFRLLAYVEKTPEAELTIKVVGYQWYWHYIYPDYESIEFDSYMITDDKLQAGDKRLFEVDNRLVVPENTVIKFLITGGDVIHSFALPALGLKTDAVPGRVNETWAKITKKGVYYGQCSELCGVNHGFMPIALEVVSKEEFTEWLETAKKKFAQLEIKKNITTTKLSARINNFNQVPKIKARNKLKITPIILND